MKRGPRPKIVPHDGGFRVTYPRGDVLWARTKKEALEKAMRWWEIPEDKREAK